jgi:hypothetical protein
MQTTPAGWKIIDRDAGVVSTTYTWDSKTNSTANTFTARLANGQLVVINPGVNAGNELFSELIEIGEVGAVVAPNGFHHLGQSLWRERFPTARFFAPEKAFDRISKKNPKAGAFEPLSKLIPLLAPGVTIVEAEISKCGECWAWSPIAGGYAWFGSDVLANMPSLPKNLIFRMMFKMTKSAPGYKIFGLAMKFIVGNKKPVLSLMLEQVKAYPPTVMVPGHGDILTGPNLAADTMALLQSALH